MVSKYCSLLNFTQKVVAKFTMLRYTRQHSRVQMSEAKFTEKKHQKKTWNKYDILRKTGKIRIGQKNVGKSRKTRIAELYNIETGS